MLQWGADEQAIADHIRMRHRDGAEIVYVTGNHDPDPQTTFDTGLLPVKAKNRIVHITANGRQFLVLHGDDAESPLFQLHALSRVGSWANRKLRSWDKRIGAFFLRSSVVRRSVIEYLLSNMNWLLYWTLGHEVRLVERFRSGGYRGVICGYFHMPALQGRHGLVYANCGDLRDRKQPVAIVPFPDVSSPSKATKYGLWRGIRADALMIRDILLTVSLVEILRQIVALKRSRLVS